jgi:2-dehydro-3-deoxyphosphogluconate aldolase/(4S)-4-hydroxy-2-oxoglutarate aldolase
VSGAAAAAALIGRERLVVIIRLERPEDWVAEALIQAEVPLVELSLVSAHALETLRRWGERFGNELMLGAGTVLTAVDASRAVSAGARYLVAPNFDDNVLAAARDADVLYVPGAFTPTEVVRAHAAGTGLVKLFPAGRLGPGYVRDLLAPLPQLRLVATGSIDAANARAFLDAGVAAVAVGGAVVREGTTYDDVVRDAAALRRVMAPPIP